VHARTKIELMMRRTEDKLERAFNQFPKDYKEILLGDFKAKVMIMELEQ
jgi:hypothetical protein